MTTTCTTDLDAELFGRGFGGDINANFNDAWAAAEGGETIHAQDSSAVPFGMQDQDEFQHLDFAALAAYQPGDDLREVEGGEVSSLTPAAKDLPAQPSGGARDAEIDRLKAMVMAMGGNPDRVEQPAPPPKTPPRKRKSSQVADLSISPAKRSSPGTVEALWSPGVGSDDRRTIGAIPVPHQAFSSSPAAKITTPTPAPKPAKKARAPAKKRTPASKKTTQQPQRPKKPLSLSELLAGEFEFFPTQDKARLLLPMLQGFDPETGTKLAKAGTMAKELQASLAHIAHQIINAHAQNEAIRNRTEPGPESNTVAAQPSEQVTCWASPTGQQNLGWASPTAEQQVDWSSLTQGATFNAGIDLNFGQPAQDKTAADDMTAQTIIFGTNDDFNQPVEHDSTTDSPDASSLSVDSDEHYESSPEPSDEPVFVPQTPQAQIMRNFEASDNTATPYDQLSTPMNNSNTATPVDQTPSFQDFLNNGGHDSYLSDAGNGDSSNKSGNPMAFSDADMFGDFLNLDNSPNLDDSGAFTNCNATGNFVDFNQAANFDMFDMNKSFDFNNTMNTGLTPIASSFGAYVHSGLTPTDATFNMSGPGGNNDDMNSFLDSSISMNVGPTNDAFTQPVNNVAQTTDPIVSFMQTGQWHNQAVNTGAGSNVFAGINMQDMASAGAARQREALMNFERRAAEGRRR
ncbi:hypothetical protein FB567DRAFT_621500 [Paraphoma chrysanthemicola]|uniref:Uncharacterized protein n=1 Tax=Paraphoma chrysanthemicola TaxID=798071 RepID=A0A8K0R8V7_9PLEO|nr:hypothetical protein FB567DRAFT_621500 [Paraphoma chrysanthemicola]